MSYWMTFTLGYLPRVTQQTHRIAVIRGKPKVYDSPALREARQELTMELALKKPREPIEGPVFLQTVWYFHTENKKRHGRWKTTRPDTDNSIKLVKDCMTRTGYWLDDSQVVCELTEKRWTTEKEHIDVFITRMSE